MTHGIVIAGANGSGKTTLGRQLAAALGYRHMDIEDYAFGESAIPYTNPRPRAEVIERLLADMKRYDRFVMSAVNGDFGDEIDALYDCVAILHAPLEIRLDRVRKRNLDQFGSRVLEGGDMEQQQKKFTEFVASRTMDQTDAWLQRVTCPILHVDGTKPVEENVRLIAQFASKIVAVRFYESVPDELLKFAVIIAKMGGKWVFCQHRCRSTYEIPGGHREAGEDILDTAKRELYEETGAVEFDLTPVCVYSVTSAGNFSGVETFGMLYYADIRAFKQELHHEIAKILVTEDLVENWTYPLIQPKLITEFQRRGY